MAIDRDRRWLLTSDAGPQLRELLVGSEDPRIWDELLPLYANLQIELRDCVDEFLALGVPDDRPEKLRAAFENLSPRWQVGRQLAAPGTESWRRSTTRPVQTSSTPFRPGSTCSSPRSKGRLR